jgi:hypothetical protein
MGPRRWRSEYWKRSALDPLGSLVSENTPMSSTMSFASVRAVSGTALSRGNQAAQRLASMQAIFAFASSRVWPSRHSRQTSRKEP